MLLKNRMNEIIEDISNSANWCELQNIFTCYCFGAVHVVFRGQCKVWIVPCSE